MLRLDGLHPTAPCEYPFPTFRLLCRLTPPLCLNFLSLIQLDSHITKDDRIVETAYTQVGLSAVCGPSKANWWWGILTYVSRDLSWCRGRVLRWFPVASSGSWWRVGQPKFFVSTITRQEHSYSSWEGRCGSEATLENWNKPLATGQSQRKISPVFETHSSQVITLPF